MIDKRMFIISLLFLWIILVSGCETTRGVAKAVAGGIGSTAQGVTQGVAKDTQSIWQAILKLDSWIKENLW